MPPRPTAGDKLRRPMKLHRTCWITTCCACLLPVPTVLAQWGGPAKVTVSNVELRDLPASVTLVGTVEPLTRSVIAAELAGLVQQMPVRQGDFVRAGQTICKLKDDTIRLQLAEAREKLKGYQATLRKWELEQDRIQRLYGSEDAAEKEVYDTQAALDLARSEVTRQQAIIAGLETNQGKMQIQAPFAGYVIDRHAEVGQWITQGGDVVEMADLATVLVSVGVPEQALPYVHVGDRASVKVEALGRSFEGRVRHVILQGDPAARTFPVEIAVPNPGYVEVDGELLPRSLANRAPTAQEPAQGPPSAGAHQTTGGPMTDQVAALLAGGMFARVTLRSGSPERTPAVPKDAVVTRNGVEYVCMVTPGKQEDSPMAVPVPVTTGLDINDWIAVTSGNLPPGMQVVTRGNENILFPSPVVIVEKLGLPDERPGEAPVPRSAASTHQPPSSRSGS